MRGPNVSRTRQILFPCTAGAVHTWHGPELPSDVLYDCYRMSSGLKPDRAFGPELTLTGRKRLFDVPQFSQLLIWSGPQPKFREMYSREDAPVFPRAQLRGFLP